jgi:hypothetical protein
MSKSIIILDTPDSCAECPLFNGFYSDMTCRANNWSINYPFPETFRQEWCPLSPLPEPKDLTQYTTGSTNLDKVVQYAHDQGFNDCLYELKGENKC